VHLGDARVLDLYCGSGAYGLEALSRGASGAVFVDRDRDALEVARRNARQADLADRARFRRRTVERYIEEGAANDGPFDLVFIDPPYASLASARIFEGLWDVVPTGGRVVIESRWGAGAEEGIPGFILEADRRYGDTRVRVYVRAEPQEER
jgi:16S rRNA (guanine966-N2)-methyltransferase